MTTRVIQALREVNDPRRQAYVRAYQTSRRDFNRTSQAAVRRLNGVLADLRPEIRSRLAAFTGSASDPFLVRMVPGIQDAVRQTIAQGTSRMNDELQTALRRGFELGGSTLPSALQAADIPVAFPSVPYEVLSSLSATAQAVLDEAGAELTNRIMRSVRMSATGLTPASGVIRDVDEMLRLSTEAAAGVRRRIGFGYQAEAIARTEIGRVYSNAQQITAEQMSEQVPDLRKSWVTVLAQRRGHLEAEARYATGGEVGPIPVKERFEVHDYSRTGPTTFLTLGGNVRPPNWRGGQRVIGVPQYTRSGGIVTDHMLFPRDPGASPGNVVNCACTTIEVVPNFEKALAAQRGAVQEPEAEEKTIEVRPGEKPGEISGPDLRKEMLADLEQKVKPLQAQLTAAAARADELYWTREANLTARLQYRSAVDNVHAMQRQVKAAKAAVREGVYQRLDKGKDAVGFTKLTRTGAALPAVTDELFRKEAERLGRITSKDSVVARAKSINYGLKETEGRSSYTKNNKRVNLSPTADRTTIWHEIGHHVEEFSGKAGRQEWAREYIKKADPAGKYERLKKLHPKMGYDEDEVCLPDKWGKKVLPGLEDTPEYIAKIYSWGSTEVISCSLGAMAEDPVAFARIAPDLFDAAVNILAGRL
jgi:hypothetical protein